MATEDIPYNVSDHATPEPEKKEDEDQPNKSVLLEVQTYLKEAIIEHNSLDTIDLTEQAKLTPGQQIAVSKQVVHHLRSVETIINDKIKELR